MRGQWTKNIREWCGRFTQAQEGNVLLFVGLGFFALVGATGIAIDMSRLQTAQTKLSNALDAAGLAAGSKANSADIQHVTENYMRVNYPEGFMDSNVTTITSTISEDLTVINLHAEATVQMSFMQIFGIESQIISADSEITRENRGLELVMVLDITGSMASSNKINDLRSAATDMVNILFGGKDEIENLWVALVPYVTAVNIGPTRSAWLRNYDLSRYPPEFPAWAKKWKGCVESRTQYPSTNGLEMTDDIPDPTKPATLFPMYFWQNGISGNNWITTTTTGSGPRRTTVTNVSINESHGSARGPNRSCGNEVTPFTANKATLINAISALQSWSGSGTMSSEGLAWGWRMISPKWRGMWGNADLPLDYHTPLMNKAVIIMTDGINEVVSGDYTAYGPVAEGRIGYNVNTPAKGVTAINSKFNTVCNAMKAQGIIVYTVTFRLNNTSAHNVARTLFRGCATKADYYFDSPDGETLRKSFRQIGDSLANLMISK